MDVSSGEVEVAVEVFQNYDELNGTATSVCIDSQALDLHPMHPRNGQHDDVSMAFTSRAFCDLLDETLSNCMSNLAIVTGLDKALLENSCRDNWQMKVRMSHALISLTITHYNVCTPHPLLSSQASVLCSGILSEDVSGLQRLRDLVNAPLEVSSFPGPKVCFCS
jgi:hypothetical protein